MKNLRVLMLAVLILASFAATEGKKQNIQQSANVNSEIKGGHHNTIITDIDQVSQIGVGNSNNVPYGQLKKAHGIDKKNDLTDGNINQVMNIYNLINGGHHNTILADGKQAAFLDKSKNSALNPAKYMTDSEKLILNQETSIFSQIAGGHHNVILVGSIQQAETEPFSSGTLIGNINQIEDINSQIFGGHHNIIIVDASQTA